MIQSQEKTFLRERQKEHKSCTETKEKQNIYHIHDQINVILT